MHTRVVWSPSLLAYDFGPQHPMAPLRLEATFGLAEELGLLDLPTVEIVGAEVAADSLLELTHAPAYVAAVRHCSETGEVDVDHGLGNEDNPVFRGMHEAAARVVSGSVDGALAVWTGEAQHAVNLAGGMHHAMPDHASGFCVYNDAAVAIRAALDAGAERVAYVDIDAHHGDGVERAFWDEPRVLTISVHETGHALFPGTGHPGDLGGSAARGHAVNLALPSRTGDGEWLRAIHSLVPQLLRAFQPQLVVSQHGCDTHRLDPLTNLAVSVDAQREAAVLLHDLVHEVADGRWLALGGGGYAVAHVVPRVWAHLLGIAAHAPVDLSTPLPAHWHDRAAATWGVAIPATMGDDVVLPRVRTFAEGYDPANDVDRAILATRRAAFHWHDLDPMLD
ncbi:acetoin utilization protein AcuC [Actinotalea sp.]|uniref:acetoin utilization protein AcuC n=1 Tax=Actinotalea sp. TaxID=1872145 RepID=UPI00356B27B4